MKTLLLTFTILCAFTASSLFSQAPSVSNVRASQRSGTKLVDIYYDLSYSGQNSLVQLEVSLDGGSRWANWPRSLSGDVGQGITSGSNKHIIWNAGIDFDGSLLPNCKVRVTARGDWVQPPENMAYIPAGYFLMGDSLDGGPAPTEVFVDAFFIDTKELSASLYNTIKDWANANGYDIRERPSGGVNHPIYGISWSDAVKFANARSEFEGLKPAYFTDSSKTAVIRTGVVSKRISDNRVDWDTTGYRIPNIAEWEKAARGGFTGKRFPWGTDTIDHSLSNYKSSIDYSYDVSPTRGRHPQALLVHPYTTPVAYFQSNEYGLYDVSGNVAEWCWDDASDTYYERRYVLGGTSILEADNARCATRITVGTQYYDNDIYGLRLVRSID